MHRGEPTSETSLTNRLKIDLTNKRIKTQISQPKYKTYVEETVYTLNVYVNKEPYTTTHGGPKVPMFLDVDVFRMLVGTSKTHILFDREVYVPKV